MTQASKAAESTVLSWGKISFPGQLKGKGPKTVVSKVGEEMEEKSELGEGVGTRDSWQAVTFVFESQQPA